MSEVRSRTLLRQLASKALVQLSGTDDAGTHRVWLHDLVHDFARRMVADPRRLHENLLEAYRIQYPAGWWSADDGYLFAHLRTHLLEANQPEELIALMLDFRWLDAKSRAGLTFDLLADFSAGKDAAPENDARRDTLRLRGEGSSQL
jgi:hypothetical protein